MIIKILTGSYNDVERGALDFALARKIPHGGWAPLGWLDKMGRNEAPRGLQEVPHSGSPNYAERNILDADGTLLITEGEPVGAAQLAQNFAARYRHPLIHIDLKAISRFQAAEAVEAWSSQNGIEVLNITGGAPNPTIDLRQVTKDLLQTIAHLAEAKEAMSRPGRTPGQQPAIPATMDEALNALESLLPLQEKIRIGRTSPRDLSALIERFGAYIENSLGWWQNNEALINSCRLAADDEQLAPDEILIRSLWEQLRGRYGLRVVR